MDGKIEHRAFIKYCVKLSKSTFGQHSLSWTAVFEWHSHFKAG
jgi:hypothetical protein